MYTKSNEIRFERRAEMRNERTVTVKMKRLELANLILVITSVIIDLQERGLNAKPLEDQRANLSAQLQAFDEKCDAENKL